jgi:uncharacterized membrane protein
MRPRWLVIGLIVSVVLNLFLIGAAAGVIALGTRMARENTSARPAALYWATQGLPQPDRRQMRQMLVGMRNAARPDAERSLALRVAAWGRIADPKPDAAAIEQTLAQSRQIDIATRTQVEDRIVAYAIGMPAGDRTILAAGMRRALSPSSPPAPAKP